MESTTIQLKSEHRDSGRPNCLILDEIDGADAKGAIQSLVEIIRADIPAKGSKQKKPYLRRPIIFICNHKYAPALRALLPYARHFNVNPPSPTRLVARLKAVLGQEKLSMMAGGSLLHQLVVSTGGDIRSCVHTLQFAAAQAKDSNDLSQALATSLGGTGLKDDRSDIAATITTVFRKVKTNRISSLASGDDRASVTRVLDAVEGLGDNSATINSLFMNLPRVSYIDPTLDRCSAAHEWLSGADLFRSGKVSAHNQMEQYSMQRLHTPSVAAAIHLLCRVELKPDLTFSARELSDAHYQRQANLGLVQKFSEGLPAKAKSAKCQNLLSTEFIPLALWILSAGEGSSSLCRAASSIDVLTKLEKQSVDVQVAVLRSMGLTYVADQDQLAVRPKDALMDGSANQMRLEPPIDRLVHYVHLKVPGGFHRKAIPPTVSF
jgi:chromosome transmission fidelity protein 18